MFISTQREFLYEKQIRKISSTVTLSETRNLMMPWYLLQNITGKILGMFKLEFQSERQLNMLVSFLKIIENTIKKQMTDSHMLLQNS